MTQQQQNSGSPNEALNILIIDDMKSLLTILESGLKRHGHQVFSALSGPEGLRIFDEHPIDVIICDLGMIDMNGWEVSVAVNERCKQRESPRPGFILLTGWGDEQEHEEQRRNYHVDRVIAKPVDITQLTDIIYEVYRH
jgi:response regulator RpfG family c-di-GMP phosphodiesterase